MDLEANNSKHLFIIRSGFWLEIPTLVRLFVIFEGNGEVTCPPSTCTEHTCLHSGTKLPQRGKGGVGGGGGLIEYFYNSFVFVT